MELGVPWVSAAFPPPPAKDLEEVASAFLWDYNLWLLISLFQLSPGLYFLVIFADFFFPSHFELTRCKAFSHVHEIVIRSG